MAGAAVLKDFRAGLDACDAAATWGAVQGAFDGAALTALRRLLRLPLRRPLADDAAPTDCCDPAVVEARAKVVGPYTDVKLLVMRAVANEFRAVASGGTAAGKARKAGTGGLLAAVSADSSDANVIANGYALLYGVTFASGDGGEENDDSLMLRWGQLEAEKATTEASDKYTQGNAGERRQLQLQSVLAVFSDRAHRQAFSALWSAFLSLGVPPAGTHPTLAARGIPGPLLVHFLSAIRTHLLPHMSHPLTLADFLTATFAGAAGELASILALQGLFVLMLDHGLEYPHFYTRLYALLGPDAFGSKHRYHLFRLLDVSLTSSRISAQTVAAFAKRLARCALRAPTPALYFALPLLRKMLQRHPNCLRLIHRPMRAEDEEDELARTTVYRGTDPYKEDEADPEKADALSSTLWELAALEKHYLPAVSLMVSALSSPAEDRTPLQYERTYGRIFAHFVTKPSVHARCSAAYDAPPAAPLSAASNELGLSGLFRLGGGAGRAPAAAAAASTRRARPTDDGDAPPRSRTKTEKPAKARKA